MSVGPLDSTHGLSKRGIYARSVRPVLSSMASYVPGEFQPDPDPELVECAAQVVLDDLLRGTDDPADFTIRESLPYQDRDLGLLRSETFAGSHDCASSLLNMAMANFTRLRPSRIPARRNSVRRCFLTVRGLIFSCPAISLLLQPCTSRLSTC